MNWQTALTRKSQPSGLPGWRRVTSTPIPALGRPITAAITKLATWSDSTLNGIAAAKDSTARAPKALLQNLGDPRRKLMYRTLRADRSGNVTAAAGQRTGLFPVPGLAADGAELVQSERRSGQDEQAGETR